MFIIKHSGKRRKYVVGNTCKGYPNRYPYFRLWGYNSYFYRVACRKLLLNDVT
jgi:hypothetical protein